MRSLSKIVKRSHVILDEKKFRLTPEITPEVTPDFDEDADRGAGEDISAAPSISQEDLQEMIDEAVAEARLMTEQARAEADTIIEDAYEQAKGIYEKASADGFDEGYRTGFEQGRDEAQALIDEALGVKNAAVEKYKSLIAGAETEAVEVIISTVEKILNKRVEEDYALIEGIVSNALKKCAYTDDLVIRVASADLEYAQSIREKILSLAPGVDSIVIRDDKSLSPGSCVIDTEAGSVDSSIATQFEHVRATFESLMTSE